MSKYNPANERVKRQYLHYLKEAKGRSERSVDAAAKAISRFDEANSFKDWRKFHVEQAAAFKGKLMKQTSSRTGGRLSLSTVHSTLAALRVFFIWLADQPRYKSRITYSDAEYFNLPEKDVRIATAERDRPFPSLEQVHHLLSVMPSGTDIERRNRALIAFTLLTGARDGAIVSLQLKHVDLSAGRVDQDAREVATKFSKTFSTWFFPVGGEALSIIEDWVAYMRGPLLRGDHDALFPATAVRRGEEGVFVADALGRRGWSNAEPVRRIFRDAFKMAGLPYFNPHSFRNTLVQLGSQRCTTPEEFKAWSQNLGHEQVTTTLTSYGNVASHRQAEIIRGLGNSVSEPSRDSDLLAQIAELVGKASTVQTASDPS